MATWNTSGLLTTRIINDGFPISSYPNMSLTTDSTSTIIVRPIIFLGTTVTPSSQSMSSSSIGVPSSISSSISSSTISSGSSGGGESSLSSSISSSSSGSSSSSSESSSSISSESSSTISSSEESSITSSEESSTTSSETSSITSSEGSSGDGESSTSSSESSSSSLAPTCATISFYYDEEFQTIVPVQVAATGGSGGFYGMRGDGPTTYTLTYTPGSITINQTNHGGARSGTTVTGSSDITQYGTLVYTGYMQWNGESTSNLITVTIVLDGSC